MLNAFNRNLLTLAEVVVGPVVVVVVVVVVGLVGRGCTTIANWSEMSIRGQG